MRLSIIWSLLTPLSCHPRNPTVITAATLEHLRVIELMTMKAGGTLESKEAIKIR